MPCTLIRGNAYQLHSWRNGMQPNGHARGPAYATLSSKPNPAYRRPSLLDRSCCARRAAQAHHWRGAACAGADARGEPRKYRSLHRSGRGSRLPRRRVPRDVALLAARSFKAQIDAAVEELRKIVDASDVDVLIGGLYKRDELDKPFERLLVINPDGQIVQTYYKMWQDARFNDCPGIFHIDG